MKKNVIKVHEAISDSLKHHKGMNCLLQSIILNYMICII